MTVTPIMLKILEITDASDSRYNVCCRVIWEAMTQNEQACLKQLVETGPVWDGNIVSKEGRGHLFDYGLATRIIVKNEQGYSGANYRGWNVYKAGNLE
jgi:hypothetical protein